MNESKIFNAFLKFKKPLTIKTTDIPRFNHEIQNLPEYYKITKITVNFHTPNAVSISEQETFVNFLSSKKIPLKLYGNADSIISSVSSDLLKYSSEIELLDYLEPYPIQQFRMKFPDIQFIITLKEDISVNPKNDSDLAVLVNSYGH
jgi:hypothetical protein